jgi:hypothetical protein
MARVRAMMYIIRETGPVFKSHKSQGTDQCDYSPVFY